jgi:hypothetical protein
MALGAGRLRGAPPKSNIGPRIGHPCSHLRDAPVPRLATTVASEGSPTPGPWNSMRWPSTDLGTGIAQGRVIL